MESIETVEKYKIVISDLHLSGGRFFGGRLNVHEEFIYDDELANFIRYFSSGKYGEIDSIPVQVELVINGDFFDYLNVPYEGEFEEAVTESMALEKTRIILGAHTQVMQALRAFASMPGKTITYLIGNHDAELFFEKVREEITRAWDPNGVYPSEKVKLIADEEKLVYEEGIEIHHGNQFEPSNRLDFKNPFWKSVSGERILSIPWGSFFVLKIINHLKLERDHLNSIKPIKALFIIGIFSDPWFTVKFGFLSAFYFIKTRITSKTQSERGIRGISKTLSIIWFEARVFQDLEKVARKILDKSPATRLVLFGHTHRPTNKVYPDGKQYINSGTWTQMIDLDWKFLRQPFRRTFVIIKIENGKIQADLRQWVGEPSPHKVFHG